MSLNVNPVSLTTTNFGKSYIKKEFKEQFKSNFELLSDEERNRQLMELEGRQHKYVEEPTPMPTDEVAVRPRLRNIRRLIPMRTRDMEEVMVEQMTENINEEVNQEIINELHRLVNGESQDEEVVGYEYPDQAG